MTTPQPEAKRNVKDWVYKRAFELAKQEIENEYKYSSREIINDAVAYRPAYLIEAIIDYLEHL